MYDLVCKKGCKSKFQHPNRQKTWCSKECQKRYQQKRHAELVAYRQSFAKTCEECTRVFTWEDKKDSTEDAFLRKNCCSSKCSRKYQKKETAARNSIIYHGVKLTIEDVCVLEQKAPATIRELVQKKALPGARWAEPKLWKRFRRVGRPKKPPAPPVSKNEVVKARFTLEHMKEVQEAALRKGIALSEWAAMTLLKCARQEARSP